MTSICYHKQISKPGWIIWCGIILFPVFVRAQVPDDINGRLWRLCKIWGFAKYHHENQCTIDWNDALIQAIDSTLVSTSNASFNSILENLLTEAGSVTYISDPLEIEADYNLNARFEWFDDPYFDPSVQAGLDSILINYRPRENCFVKANDYSTGYSSYLDFRPDTLQLSDDGYNEQTNRLLVFFYYWNIINYFHADRNLMDQDWDTTLLHFIPVFREAQNEEAFHLRFQHLVSYLNDTHGFTSSPVLENHFGSYYPHIAVSLIENQTVVTKIGSTVTGITIGDIITHINGMDVNILRDSLARYSAASNEPTLQRIIDQKLLLGPFNSAVQLSLLDSVGVPYMKTLNRLFTSGTYSDLLNQTDYPTWEITDCGYGYVHMGKLFRGHIPQMYASLKNTPAIVFDLRNYPNGTVIDLIHLLFPEPITFALLGIPDDHHPGWYNWWDNIVQSDTFINSNPYNGKVINLVNAATLSQAEYTVMALQQHPNAITIGSQTAGADGNVSSVTLPGGLTTVWTSLNVFYPDTVNAQRVGVKIDSVVTPTIEGIRQGKDEVLMAALDCLVNSSNDLSYLQNFSLYPNPASDEVAINLESDYLGECVFTFYNTLGQPVFETESEKHLAQQTFTLPVHRLSPGIYTLLVQMETQAYSKNLIIQR